MTTFFNLIFILCQNGLRKGTKGVRSERCLRRFQRLAVRSLEKLKICKISRGDALAPHRNLQHHGFLSFIEAFLECTGCCATLGTFFLYFLMTGCGNFLDFSPPITGVITEKRSREAPWENRREREKSSRNLLRLRREKTVEM